MANLGHDIHALLIAFLHDFYSTVTRLYYLGKITDTHATGENQLIHGPWVYWYLPEL